MSTLRSSQIVESSTLTAPEEHRLESLEQVIRGGMKVFIAVGEALIEIRDKRLYREISDTFEGYCQVRWGFTRRRADQLIAATNIVAEVAERVIATNENPGSQNAPRASGNAVPQTEKQARALAAAPQGERAAAWHEAVETAPKGKDGEPKVTAAHVEKVVAKRLGATECGEPPAPPTEAPTDQIGRELPADAPAVCAAFACIPQFRSMMQRISTLKGEFEQLLDGPAGKWPSRERQQWDAKVQGLRAILRFCVPFALCPYCRGRKCECCKHTGYLPEDVYAVVPSDIKGHKGKRPEKASLAAQNCQDTSG